MLIGGREPVTITVVEYDESWPVRFAHLRGLVEATLGSRALAVEHRKIELSDRIHVVDPGNYIGRSAWSRRE